MKVYYIDPQSYNVLGDYDKYLLENIRTKKMYFCSDKLPYSKIANTEIKYNYYYSNYNGLKKIFSYVLSQIRLYILIKKNKPDLIHFQWLKIPVVDYYLLKKIKRVNKNCKLIFTAHNVLPHDSGTKYVKVYRKIYNFVDHIIVHANKTKNEIESMFNVSDNKITVIPFGFFPPKVNKTRNSNFKGIVFSFIGFLSDYKGLDILLDAWCGSDILLNSSDCRLIIAGAGTVKCIDNIPMDKNIVFENYFHTEEQLAQIIANTDIAVLPYRKISQSGVLLTYLSKHIPVIVSNIGGLTQPFEIGNVGWILDDLNSGILRLLLESLIVDKEKIQAIKENLQLWEVLDDYYDWGKIGEITDSHYNEWMTE